MTPDYVAEFPDMFGEKMFDKMPPSRGAADHAIELLPGTQPHCSKIYSVPKAY